MKPLATIICLVAIALGAFPVGASPVRAVDGAAIAAGPPFDATLAEIQANVFTPSCSASFCHGAGMQANLHLEDGFSFDSLVNVASVEVPGLDRVKPFDPDASYLICKLEACPGMVGQLMPIIGGPLDQSVIDVIREWILLGAEEDGPISVDAATWGQIKATYRR